MVAEAGSQLLLFQIQVPNIKVVIQSVYIGTELTKHGTADDEIREKNGEERTPKKASSVEFLKQGQG